MPLVDAARELFRERFTGYHVADERYGRGFHPDNPVNLPSAHGVQVELPPGLRGIGDFGEPVVPRQDGLVGEVVAALVRLAGLATESLLTASASTARRCPGARSPGRLVPDGSATPGG